MDGGAYDQYFPPPVLLDYFVRLPPVGDRIIRETIPVNIVTWNSPHQEDVPHPPGAIQISVFPSSPDTDDVRNDAFLIEIGRIA